MTESAAKKSGICMVVDESQLQISTREGWRIIESFGADVPIPLIYKDSYNGTVHKHDAKGFVIPPEVKLGREQKWVVELDEESAIAKLAKERDDASERAKQANIEVMRVKNAAEKSEAKTTQLALENASLSRQIKALHDAEDVLRDRMRKMENDLGRVREEIGAERFRAIVEGVNP